MVQYAVEIRNVHTAIHELFEVTGIKDARRINKLIEYVESHDELQDFEEYAIWDEINSMKGIVSYEINFRETYTNKKDGWKYYEDIKIINEHSYDLYC